jgi:hypothetical protein
LENQPASLAQSRLVTFFSAAYFSADARIIGLMIWASDSYQSEEKFHLAPSHVWMRAQREP